MRLSDSSGGGCEGRICGGSSGSCGGRGGSAMCSCAAFFEGQCVLIVQRFSGGSCSSGIDSINSGICVVVVILVVVVAIVVVVVVAAVVVVVVIASTTSFGA